MGEKKRDEGLLQIRRVLTIMLRSLDFSPAGACYSWCC